MLITQSKYALCEVQFTHSFSRNLSLPQFTLRKCGKRQYALSCCLKQASFNLYRLGTFNWSILTNKIGKRRPALACIQFRLHVFAGRPCSGRFCRHRYGPSFPYGRFRLSCNTWELSFLFIPIKEGLFIKEHMQCRVVERAILYTKT